MRSTVSTVNDNVTVNDTVIKEDTATAAVGLDLVALVNSMLGTKFRNTDKVKRQWAARLKEGFTLEEVALAIKGAKDSQYHKESKYKYLTAEFFTRSDKIEMWKGKPEPPKQEMVY